MFIQWSVELNMKFSEVQLCCLRQPFVHCLYFICKRKFYALTHVQIAQEWKSTLTEDHFSCIGKYPKMLPRKWSFLHSGKT